MGWSCREDAAKVMELWTAMCVASTGSSNVWKSGSEYFMEETSRKEHDDGAITGSILKMLPNMPDGSVDIKKDGSARKVGSYKINGDGTIARGPAFLKALAKEAATMTHSECFARRMRAKPLAKY